MKIKVLSLKQLSEAATLLKGGEIVAFPTETVYGLGAPLFSPNSIEKIFEAKQRPYDNPLIAHIASLSSCIHLARDLSPTFYQLAEAFFPGPLTLVVNKHPDVPHIATGGLQTIAIRMPDHPTASSLIKEVGEPLVAPSANISGRPSSTTAEHVIQDFSKEIAAVVDGGPCTHGMESTVVDLVTFEKPTLLRLGALSRETIEAVLGSPLAQYTKGPKSSPGMRYRHYAPQVPVHVFLEKHTLEKHLSENRNALLLSSEPLSISYSPLESKTLYSHLRLADKEGYDEVVIYCPKCSDETLANRLEKIAHENSCH